MQHEQAHPGLLGNNMFAYCNNNPANYSDPCGTCLHNLSFTDCNKCKAIREEVKQMWDDCTTFVSSIWNNITESVSNAWDTTVEWCEDACDNVVYTYENIDWEYVSEQTIKTGIVGTLGGAATGAYAGMIGAPITEGLSIPACAAVGAAIGFVGGVVEGFFEALLDELWR